MLLETLFGDYKQAVAVEHSSEEKTSGGKWRERRKEGGRQEMHHLILKKKLNMLHHTTQLSQKKKQDITEKSNDLSCKKQKEHARIAWINFEYSRPSKAN